MSPISFCTIALGLDVEYIFLCWAQRLGQGAGSPLFWGCWWGRTLQGTASQDFAINIVHCVSDKGQPFCDLPEALLCRLLEMESTRGLLVPVRRKLATSKLTTPWSWKSRLSYPSRPERALVGTEPIRLQAKAPERMKVQPSWPLSASVSHQRRNNT